MTTALSDKDNVLSAFRSQCDGYLVKPIDATKLYGYLQLFRLIDAQEAEALGLSRT